MTADCQKLLLGVFAKYWEPGKVKSRLAQGIGEQAAADVYQYGLRYLVESLARFPAEKTLCVTPANRMADFQALLTSSRHGQSSGIPDNGGDGSWQVWEQATGDLGQRMWEFFLLAFERGYQHVILLGSDAPTVPVEYLTAAQQALHDHSIVLGPARDGGYYLIAGRPDMPNVFHNIPWSTPAVFRVTSERLQGLGSSWTTVPAWYDIDEASDLTRLSAELATRTINEPNADRLAQCLAEVGLEVEMSTQTHERQP